MINPMSWLLFSLGLVGRSLKIACVLGPIAILGYLMGLPYGPRGVAFGYSAMLTLWVVPHIAWCVHDTPVHFKDVFRTVGRPFISGLVAAAFAFGVQWMYAQSLAPILRLALGGTALVGAYLVMLLYVMGQSQVYVDLIRGLSKPPLIPEKVLVGH
jgi:PST family polysaccharide transporter